MYGRSYCHLLLSIKSNITHTQTHIYIYTTAIDGQYIYHTLEYETYVIYILKVAGWSPISAYVCSTNGVSVVQGEPEECVSVGVVVHHGREVRVTLLHPHNWEEGWGGGREVGDYCIGGR